MKDFDDNCPKVNASFDGDVLRAEIPEGICLKKGLCGYGLYATKSFKSGQALYLNHYEAIDDVQREFKLIANNITYNLETITHACITNNKKRALYNFDAMFNHSCNPNTYSYSTSEMSNNRQYYTVALRNIASGEELTCNYNLFEYDCSDKGIDNCNCQEDNCQKKIWGFKWLEFDEQIRLLKSFDVDLFILEKFFDDNAVSAFSVTKACAKY